MIVRFAQGQARAATRRYRPGSTGQCRVPSPAGTPRPSSPIAPSVVMRSVT